jgi:peptidylprolyl isomerase
MIPLRKLGEKANEVGIGDVIEIDDRIGIIRFIGSGRVQVDFNHKYAGRTLVYNANILKKLESDDEKITNLIHRRLPIELSEIKFENNESEIQISLPENTFLIEGIQIIKRGISADIFKFVPNIKSVIFLEKYDNTSTKNDATKQADSEKSPDTNIESMKEDSNSEQQSESTDDANKLDGTDATKHKS